MHLLESAILCYAATTCISLMVSLLFVKGLSKVNHGAVSPSPSSAHMVHWLQLVTTMVTTALCCSHSCIWTM